MAEWSKALDSSSSLHLKAWVRIPLEPSFLARCLPSEHRNKALWRNG